MSPKNYANNQHKACGDVACFGGEFLSLTSCLLNQQIHTVENFYFIKDGQMEYD
jgi:hypothetical protein